MTDAVKLEPCPFCGPDSRLLRGTGSWMERGEHVIKPSVKCATCGASALEEVWNRRAGLEAVRREEREPLVHACPKCGEPGWKVNAKAADGMRLAVRRETIEACAKVADRIRYGDAVRVNAVAVAKAIADDIRALSQEGAAEGEGQDGGVLRREKIAPSPRGGSVTKEGSK